MKHQVFYFEDPAEAAMSNILTNHRVDAETKVAALLTNTTKTEGGCWVTPTATYSKTQMRGRQWPSYRFVLSVVERVSMPEAVVVRHKCHNRLCINPEHLQFGTQADNKRDDVARDANGIDYDYL